jgi:hypothetical protein
MPLRLRPLSLAAAAAATLVATAPPSPSRHAEELVLENAERGHTLRVPLRPGEIFSVVYQHSIYDQPVTEDFVVDDRGRIVLEAVESPSAAVREYFGLTAPGQRHAVVRPMREVVFRVAEGTPQRLRAGGVERSFLELGEHGDRIVMRARR